jgi:nucleoid-associated protein YgaU
VVQTPGAKINVTSGETYRVQANDTLPDISRRAYGSDKYAPAILAFNSQYNPDKAVSDNLKTNPRLLKDMGLVLPTREFLTSRYAHLIQESPVNNDPPPITIKPPTGVAQTSNPNSTPPIQAKTPDPTRRYRVPDQGQYIIEIARQTLGNPSRWSEILRLNPSLRTEYPIPGGTELQLPAN